MGLIFDGVDLEVAFGVLVNGAGTWKKPARDRELVHVPGRNGDLIYDNGCWENVEIPYDICIKAGWKEKYEEFCQWLCSHNGYFRLEDPDRHPGVYRMAEFVGPLEPELWFVTDNGTVTINFNCKPQQFLISGEDPVYVPYTAVADGYYNASGSWVAPGNGLGISTLLLAVDDFMYSEFSAVIRNTSDQAKTLVIGRGFYDSSAQLLDTAVVQSVLQPGGTYTIGPNTDRTVAYLRISVYCEDGLDGVTLAVSGSSVDLNVNLSAPYETINNPTRYACNPLIQIHFAGAYGFTGFQYMVINDFKLSYTPFTEDYDDIFIDTELEYCYFSDGESMVSANQYIQIVNDDPRELRDFPYFMAGDNKLLVVGDEFERAQATGVTVIPRWYTI